MAKAKKVVAVASEKQQPRGEYEDLLDSVRRHFDAVAPAGPLFTTDAKDLFSAFLDALPEDERQHHTCNACRHFVERYGGLVAIDAAGRTSPVMWGEAPGFYGAAFSVIRKIVAKARVRGVFLSGEKVWGHPVTGEWHHMAVTPTRAHVFSLSVMKNAGQAMAEKREEYAMLCRGLAEFPQGAVAQALALLESEALYRNEKCLGPARWLAGLHAAREGLRGRARDNVTWLAVAKAPPGFCHVRSTMIGTLLEDFSAGLSVEAIRARFSEKMHPLQYQRPQRGPDEGNIAQAEKIVAALQSAGSLARRFARLDDLQVKLWVPAPAAPEPAGGGVFGHLRPGGAGRGGVEIPAVEMTWEKFRRTVTLAAEKIEVLVPSSGHFLALCTAINPDAPPILQWDNDEARNPVNWYVYSGGSPCGRWGLVAGSYAPVTAVTTLPPEWAGDGKHVHQGSGVVLVLDGCVDTNEYGGLALFPEDLKSEYHGIRRTIEAYSRAGVMAGRGEASACGIDLRKGQRWDCRVRVTSSGGKVVSYYVLDRWD